MQGFILPPENQGQIVEVSYAAIDGWVIRKWYDRSDGETRYDKSRALIDDQGDYWNRAPKNKRWVAITEAEADKLLAEDESR